MARTDIEEVTTLAKAIKTTVRLCSGLCLPINFGCYKFFMLYKPDSLFQRTTMRIKSVDINYQPFKEQIKDELDRLSTKQYYGQNILTSVMCQSRSKQLELNQQIQDIRDYIKETKNKEWFDAYLNLYATKKQQSIIDWKKILILKLKHLQNGT